MSTTPHERLERAMWDVFWIPDDVVVIDRDDLLLLSCPRPISILNTVMRASTTAERADALVDEARAAHAHTSSRWWITDTRPSAHLEAALGRGGYAAGHHHEARGIAVASFQPRSRSAVTVHAIDSLARMRHAIDTANAAFERADALTDELLARELAQCTGPAPRVHRFVAYEAERPVATASMTVFPELGFGLLWGGGTVPSARGRGAYAALLAARIARAHALTIPWVGLYARSATSAPIVTRLGFARWGSMTYWDRPR